jgi:hypothetical protein
VARKRSGPAHKYVSRHDEHDETYNQQENWNKECHWKKIETGSYKRLVNPFLVDIIQDTESRENYDEGQKSRIK